MTALNAANTGATMPAPSGARSARLAQQVVLVGLVAVARWAAGLPGASLTLSGPLRAAPAAALAVVLAVAAAAARRSPDEAGGRPGAAPPSQALDGATGE
jgi:hypothetical protein